MEGGGLARMAALAQSMDGMQRMYGVWALKNMLFNADSICKQAVMEELTYPVLLDLLRGRLLRSFCGRAHRKRDLVSCFVAYFIISKFGLGCEVHSSLIERYKSVSLEYLFIEW